MKVESLGQEDPLEEGMAIHSYLQNPMDRRDWQATVHRVVKSWTRLKWLSMHACLSILLSMVYYLNFSLHSCLILCPPLVAQLDFLPFELEEACVFLSWDLSCLYYFLRILSFSSRSFLSSLVTNAVLHLAASPSHDHLSWDRGCSWILQPGCHSNHWLFISPLFNPLCYWKPGFSPT